MGLYENLTNIIFLNSNVHLRNSGGARICGEVVLVNFWCHFEEISISIFSISVSQNQAICGLFKYFWLISMHFQFSYIILCGVYTYVCAVLQCCHPPYAPFRDDWLLTEFPWTFNIFNHTLIVTTKNKYHHLSK